MTRTRTVFLFGLILSVLTLVWILPARSSPPHAPLASSASAQSSNTDWPQLGRDYQRTGYSPQTVKTGANAIKWLWHPDDRWATIAHAAQPVIASGMVIIGDSNGVIHALHESNGTNKWTFDTGMLVYGSAAVSGNKVFVGSQNGILYALHADTGQPVWQYQTGGGITASPLLYQDRVYIGSKDGKLYCLDQASGSLLWHRDTGAPITMSAAASSQGKVFVGAENLKAYAFEANTGQTLWTTQLKGDSFRYFWPVVSDSRQVVIFRTEPSLSFHDMLGHAEPLLENGHCPNFNFGECHPDIPAGSPTCGQTCDGVSSIRSTASHYTEEQNRIREYLTTNPDRETFYVLKTGDGNKAFTAPVLYTAGTGWPGSPPVLNETQDTAYVFWRTYYSRYDSSTTVRPYADVGTLDLLSGIITHFSCGSIGGDSCRVGWDDFHLVGDETSHFTLTSNALLISNEGSLGGIALGTELSFFTVSATGWYRTDLVMRSQQWPDIDSYAGYNVYPVDHAVVANGVIFYKSGLLGAIQ